MEVSQLCNLCNEPHDQMLMLACVHDPCIQCAASTYAQQVRTKRQHSDIYVCQLCQQETLLDNETIVELMAVANKIKTPREQGSHSTPYHNHKEIVGKKVLYYCHQHSEEEITYYCFTCWRTICPQCAIHGTHKEHEVKLIKKTINQMKGQYMRVIGCVNEAQNDMGKIKEYFLKAIKDINERHSRDKNLLCREFQMLKGALQNKERELLRQLDEANKINLGLITGFLEAVNINQEDSNKLKRHIESILRKDEVLIFEEHQKINDLSSQLNGIIKKNESLVGTVISLNSDLLQQEIKEKFEAITILKPALKKQPIRYVPNKA